jgi:hypothetical protein
MFQYVAKEIKSNKERNEILKNMKIKSIALVNNEFAKMKGKAKINYKKTGHILKSPVSNKDCIYYSLLIEKMVVTKEENSDGHIETIRTWENMFEEKKGTFFIDDGDDKVLIDPKKTTISGFENFFYFADNDIEKDHNFSNINYSKIVLETYDFSKISIKEQYSLFNNDYHNYRITEYYIEPDKEIFAFGYINNSKEDNLKSLVENNNISVIISDKEENLNKFNSMMVRAYNIIYGFLIVANIIFYFAFKLLAS